MNPNTENSEFCEQFVNNLGMITLVEAGLDWNPLEAQSAHNQRQTKGFPKFFGILSRWAKRVLHLPPDFSRVKS